MSERPARPDRCAFAPCGPALRRSPFRPAGAPRAALLSGAIGVVLAACGGERTAAPLAGDPERGRLLLRQYACASCHHIPGVATARGNVGPPLNGIARRVYLGGVLPNTPDNMVRWIRNPQQFDPQTAMPNLQVPQQQAQDMVAYLLRLR